MKVAQRFGTGALFASIALVAALGIVVPRTATALPPETLGVQGRFVTATGQPIPDGQYAVTVSFYKLANDALPLFSETQPNVKVSGGLFTLQAGATQSLAPAGFKAGDATWVGIQVSNEIELPRVALKFVPYALRAQTAGDLACSGCVKAGHLDAAALQPYAKTNTLATSAMLPALDGVPCGSGLVVKGLNVNGTLNCVAAGTYTAGAGLTLTNGQFALAPPSGAVLGGIKATTCGAGKVVTGVAADGSLTCAASFTGNLLGDVTGPSTGTVVTALQNVPVAAGAPFDQAVLKYDGVTGKWTAAIDQVGGGNGGGLTGSGTAGNLARWTDGATLGVSLLFDDGSHVGIGTTSPTESLHVVGNTKITGNAVVAGSVEFGNAGAVLKADQGGSAELGSSTVAGAKPYLDLHYGTGASQDFNVRLANDADRTLTITGTGGDAKLQVAGEVAATRMCIGADCRNSWNAADGNSVSPMPRTCPIGQVPVSTGPYKWGCQVNCAYGTRDCNNQSNDGCETNVNTSSANCSECGIACSPNHITPLCTSGSCQSGVCHAGYDDCNTNKQTDGCEISLTANTSNCGQCGQTCSSNGMASITCGPTPLGSPQPGYCNGACLLGRADCNVNKLGDGCEIVTTVDVDNCGGCGKICSNTNVVSRTCGSSVCTSPCNLGFADYNSDKLADGCEINTTNNLSHCSACGLACSSNHISPTCVGSSCQMGVCEADYADCNGNKQADGCEVHLPTNMANCGTCGDACSGAGMSVQQCAAGACTGTCSLSSSEAFADCNGNLRTDGCEINLTTNPDSCGGCGIVCSNSNMETRTCSTNLGDPKVTGFNATFTTCSYSGRTGPDQGSCDSTYSGNPALAGKVTLQGGIQRYIVATTGTYDIDAYGAQGGTGNNQPGGYGARSKGRFTLQKGDVLWFLVGQQSPGATYEGGGGGGSFVVKGANYASATPLVIAGGGGGGRYSHGQGQPGQAGTSGSTTYWAGGSGGNGGSSSAGGYGGGGFTGNGATWGGNGSGGQAFVNGGAGGVRGYTSSQYSSDGGFGGGGGGYQSGSSSTTGSSGAGGGGGYSGGGAGYSSPGYGGGGGSYNTGTDQILTTGAKSGNGQINMVGALGEPGKCNGACKANFADCNADKLTDGCETPTNSTVAHCGGCGQACSANHIASPTCAGSQCNGSCDNGYADCNGNKLSDGCEMDIVAGSITHCGACNDGCSTNHMSSTQCAGSNCTGTCSAEYFNCDSDMRSNGCEKFCSSSHVVNNSCGGGTCTGTCEAGWANCDGDLAGNGCETHIDVDINNCGSCGSICNATGLETNTCTGGTCSGTCLINSSQANGNCNNALKPDGCEINLTTNADNCGSCGVVCSNDHMATRICTGNLADPVVTGFSATFSTCGYNSGRTGPDQGSCNSTYSGQPALAGKVTVQSGIQRYVVATTGTYDIDAYGAQGGTGNNQPGGYGARSKGRFKLQKDDILWLLVGQQGLNATYEAGGAGGSFVVKGANPATGTPLVIAGGGGGGRYSQGQGQPGQAGTSGSTTYWAGGSGGAGGSSSAGGYGGGGFTGNGATWGGNGSGGQAFVNGGLGGVRGYTSSQYSSDGGFGGGGGSYQSGTSSTTGSSGAGGGGGYSGGGAGYSSPGYGGGGGSYNAGTNQILTTGAKSGTGQVVITGVLGEPGACSGACASNYADCNANKQTDGCEVPTLTDVTHCGGCGKACSNNHVSSPTCGSGTCTGNCDSGFDDCNGNKLSDGCEINIQSGNITHCGTCGDGCSTNNKAATDCSGGNCTGACNADYFNCDSNLRSNGCEKYCSPNGVVNNSCSASTCTGTCDAGRANCNADIASDGCEITLAGDILNCGSCGKICSPTGLASNSCTSGACTGVCKLSTTEATFDCNSNIQADGCEIDLTTNADNCGSCGVACSNNHMQSRTCGNNLQDTAFLNYAMNFTTCGAGGRFGPSQGSCDAAYGANVVQVTTGIQRWLVPKDGWYFVEAQGAQGGYANGQQGGYGARMKGRFKFSKNDVLWILVGQQSPNATYVGGGGGGSFVVKGAAYASATPLVVAGGGGGAKYNYGGGNGQGGTTAINGGQTYFAGGTNGSGGGSSGSDYGGYGGGGYTGNGGNNAYNAAGGGKAFVNGGAGGAYGYNSAQYSSEGGFGGGGGGFQRDSSSSTSGSSEHSGAGGGGGYSGGGAGWANGGPGYGAGGGSYNIGELQSNTSAAKTGDGKVTISGALAVPGACNGTCEAGFGDCNADKLTDGCETSTSANPANCGACGNVCSANHIASPTCSGSACTGACNSGYADCNGNKLTDGCEVNFTSGDIANCGACGDACSTNHMTSTTCGGSNCAGTCAADYFNCDGNLRSNGCEKYCSSNGVVSNGCSTGFCSGVCALGRANCDGDIAGNGCEIDSANDKNNCGGCGIVCSGLDYCDSGTCKAPKRVFLSNNSVQAYFGGVGPADSNCQSWANSAGLGGAWKAWLSANNGGNQVASRFSQASVRYVKLDGTMIANNWADLTNGDIASPIDRNEYNTYLGGNEVFTGTQYNGGYVGSGSNNCSSWTTSTSSTSSSYQWYYGRSDTTGSGWSYSSTHYGGQSSSYRCSTAARRLYCFEQ